ncbi:MAG: hypothetical protein HFJ44_02570 [Clostridia bacterium]|nr:hypothetical protein [Clostridia bacterium]
MRLCGTIEDDEEIERAKRQLREEEDEAKEQEAEEQAYNDPDGAASKFEHSMDDDDEAEDEDNNKNKKKKNKNDKDDDEDNNEDNNENNDEDDNDNDEENNKDNPNKNKDDEDNPEDKKKSDENSNKSNDDIDKDKFEDPDDDYNSRDNKPNEEPPSTKDEDLGYNQSYDPREQAKSQTENAKQNEDPNMPQNTKPNTGPATQTGAGAETGSEVGAAAESGAGAETGAAAGTEAAAGTAAGAEAAAGTATAAEGAAAGTGVAAGAGVGAGAAAIAIPLLIVLAVILAIIILIGVAGFFTTMPQFLWNKLKKLALDIWDGVQGYVIGMDESLVNKDDIIGVAQYLYDMGYDLVGMGFAESVEIYGQKDEKGNEIPVTDDHVKNEIKKIDAPYLRAYLVAENRTFLINNFCYNLQDFVNSFFDGSIFGEGFDSWGTGLIDLDRNLLEGIGMPITALRVGEFNVGELIKGVKIERETNTMRIRRLNLELDFWNTHNDYTYFSLAGWAGRYGKPFELMLTVHLSTMAPDLAKEIALNKDLDAKVHVKLKKTDFNGKVYVDGKSIAEIEEDKKNGDETYDDTTIRALKNLENKYASEIKTSIPYISSVTNHWFRNVYFEGTDSEGASGSTQVGIDEDEDGLEDYNEPSGVKTQKTRSLTSDDNVYTFGDETEEEITYQGDPIEGVTGTITFKGKMASGVTQNKDAVRGVTNPTTKKLFSDKYYIYDGTISTAKKIQEARKNHDNSLKQPIRFTKDSLNAFAMLEASETLDSQFVYRDLKELVIELGYFEREDFDVIEKQILEWPIPDYIPGEWPDRKVEKQVLEYGTLIACDETMAASLGISLEELRKMTGTDEEDETSENEDDPLSILKGSVFIGDSYIEGLKANGGIEDSEFFGQTGVGPQYWLNNISSLPESARKIFLYLGVNRPDEHETMKNLIDALSQKYESAHIYVIEVMHLGRNYNNVDKINAQIDTFNAQVREKCKRMDNASFIDASDGLTSGGYLANTDSSGIHMQSSEYQKWAKNIAMQIKDKRLISGNDTDEKFVVDVLDAAKSVLTEIKEKNFTYGTPENIPPKTGETQISADGFVSWVLNKCGYTDQPENGLTVGEKGDFISYCESKKWKRIENQDDVQVGDIVFTGQLDEDGKKASNVYICAGDGKRYECSSSSHITDDQPLSGSSGNFMCAYRVTGGEAISTGFKEGLDVISMGNGKVIELLDEGNNLFSLGGLSEQIYGENKVAEIEEVEGRKQTDEGLKIKLTDTALRGYTLILYGFDVSGVSVGQEVKTGDILGKTVNSDMCVILLDKDRSIIEDVEEYIKVPKKEKSGKYNGSAINIQNIEGMDPELASLIEEIAGPYEAEYPGIVNILKAISMNESGGGTNPAAGDDPMQAAESMGQSAGSSVGGKRRSVEAAVAALTDAWDKAKANGVDDLRVVIQSYNYGSGFVDYVVKNGSNKKYTKELAQSASSYYASKKGWSSYGDPNYVDPKIYNYLPDLQE